MRHFFEWFAERGDPRRPWLILGKGPTFGLRSRFDLGEYDLLSLNHVVREHPVRLAHIIDLDVVDACGETLLRRAEHVVLPWYPHIGNAPGSRSLDQWAAEHPILRQLASAGRLLWYDLSIAPRRHGPGPVVQAAFFSAEAAVSLLALAGVERVRSLGVDGGAGYSADFDDLAGQTLLANGQPAFDLQFAGIARTVLRTGVDFAPLDLAAPLVVCIASAGPNRLPDLVLEYTIRKHTSMTVQVHPVRRPADLESLPAAWLDRGRGEGRVAVHQAIVIRSGSVVLDDLRRVWAPPFVEGRIRIPQGSRLGDPSALPAIAMVAGRTGDEFRRLLRAMLEGSVPAGATPGRSAADLVRADLSPAWNRRDALDSCGASVLWYAQAGREPWISRAHPLGHHWMSLLIEAVEAGYISRDVVREEVEAGHVRPSLLEQIARANLESLLVSREAQRLDASFRPPGTAPLTAHWALNPVLVARTLAREGRRRLRAYRLRRAAYRGAPAGQDRAAS